MPDADTPKYVVPPPIPPVVALALIIMLDRPVPVPFLPRAVSLTVGIPLLVLGVGLWAWGVTGLLRRGESPDPRKPTTQLVTGGPFRLSRNPIYTGGTVGLLGLALLVAAAGLVLRATYQMWQNRLPLGEGATRMSRAECARQAAAVGLRTEDARIPSRVLLSPWHTRRDVNPTGCGAPPPGNPLRQYRTRYESQ